MPYDDITSYEMPQGGWAPMVRELRLEVEGRAREMRFRGNRTCVEDLVHLLTFVVPRRPVEREPSRRTTTSERSD